MYFLITKNCLVCIYFWAAFTFTETDVPLMVPEGWQSSRQLLFIPRIKTWQTQTSPQPLFYTSSSSYSLPSYVCITSGLILNQMWSCHGWVRLIIIFCSLHFRALGMVHSSVIKFINSIQSSSMYLGPKSSNLSWLSMILQLQATFDAEHLVTLDHIHLLVMPNK